MGNIRNNHLKEALLVFLIVCYFTIEGVADSTLTTHRGFFVMMLLGLVMSNMKFNIENTETDENFANR